MCEKLSGFATGEGSGEEGGVLSGPEDITIFCLFFRVIPNIFRIDSKICEGIPTLRKDFIFLTKLNNLEPSSKRSICRIPSRISVRSGVPRARQ